MTDTDFVDSFEIDELVFPQASVIRLHLYDRDEPQKRAAVPPARMSTETARRLAQKLVEAADALEGVHDRRQ